MCASLQTDFLLEPAADVAALASPSADAHSTRMDSIVQTKTKAPPNLNFSVPMSYGPHLKLKRVVLNLWGIAYALSLLLTSVLLLPVLFMLTAIADLTGDSKVHLYCFPFVVRLVVTCFPSLFFVMA